MKDNLVYLMSIAEDFSKLAAHILRLKRLKECGLTLDPFSDGPEYEDDTNNISEHIEDGYNYLKDCLNKMNFYMEQIDKVREHESL